MIDKFRALNYDFERAPDDLKSFNVRYRMKMFLVFLITFGEYKYIENKRI